jgi:SAM-dependent methyltransferase
LAIPPWYPDELVHAGPEHLDAAYVAGYDRKAGPEWTDDLALLRALGLGGDRTLVDLGAGTGMLATAAAPLCRRVVAVDVSPAMVAVLRDRAEQLGLRNLECVPRGLLSYERQGEPADFVYTRNTLHHLPDFWKVVALQRIAAMLRPDGILRLRDLIFSFEPPELTALSKRGLRARLNASQKVGHAPNWRCICARSTALSAGYWSQCWNTAASRFSVLNMTRHTSMRRTCA